MTLPEWGSVRPGTEAARALLSVFGTTVLLPDNTEIRLIIRPSVELTEDTKQNTERVEYMGYIPNDPEYYGTLAPKQSIVSPDRTYFVNAFNRDVAHGQWLAIPLAPRETV